MEVESPATPGSLRVVAGQPGAVARPPPAWSTTERDSAQQLRQLPVQMMATQPGHLVSLAGLQGHAVAAAGQPQVLLTDSPALQTLLVTGQVDPASLTQAAVHQSQPQQAGGSRNNSVSSSSTQAMTIDLTGLTGPIGPLTAQAQVGHAGQVLLHDPGSVGGLHHPQSLETTSVGSMNMNLGGPGGFTAVTSSTQSGHQYAAAPGAFLPNPANAPYLFNPGNPGNTATIPATTSVATTDATRSQQQNERNTDESPMSGVILTQQSPVASH